MTLYRSSLDDLPIKALSSHVIVLDLDETLVHSSEDMAAFRALKISSDPNLIDIRKRSYVITLDDVVERKGAGIKTQLWGIMRPHLKEFLVFCFSYFKVVAVWSAGQTKYVNAIVDAIFGDIAMPHVVYTWPDCDTSTGIVEKPLIKMIQQVPGLSNYMSLANTLVLDDRHSTYRNNPKNGVLIPAYNPKPNINALREEDIALLQLKTWLERPEIRGAPDVRALDKDKIFSTPLSQLSAPVVPPKPMMSDALFTSTILVETPKTPRSPYLPKGCIQTDTGIVCDPSLRPPDLLRPSSGNLPLSSQIYHSPSGLLSPEAGSLRQVTIPTEAIVIPGADAQRVVAVPSYAMTSRSISRRGSGSNTPTPASPQLVAVQ